MASSCCGTKKQRMNNEQCNNHNNHAKTNGHLLTNGHSSTLTNGHNGHLTNGHAIQNGHIAVDQVSNKDMCFFCFEVLSHELNRLDGPPKPTFTDDA